MRNIFLLSMLFVSVATFSQSKSDLKRRAGDTKQFREFKEITKFDSDRNALVMYRIGVLTKIVGIELSEAEQEKFAKTLVAQYDKVKPAYSHYKETKSTAAKVELMRILVDNEQEIRGMLTPEQLLIYLRYGDKVVTDLEFEDNFMSDHVLNKFKQELQ